MQVRCMYVYLCLILRSYNIYVYVITQQGGVCLIYICAQYPRAQSSQGQVHIYQANPDMLYYIKYISHSVLAHFSSFSSLKYYDSIFFVRYKAAKTQPMYVFIMTTAQNIYLFKKATQVIPRLVPLILTS